MQQYSVKQKFIFGPLPTNNDTRNTTNYDATAAFNRILAGLASITCHQVGLPHIAGNVMFQLLKQMSFHLVTGFSQLDDCFKNDQDGITGQGVLARCSSGVATWHVPFTF